MKRRIYANLIIVCLLSAVLTAVSVTMVYYSLFQNRVREDLRINLELLKGTGFFDTPEIKVSIANIRTDGDDLRITWIAADGKVLYDNDNDVEKLDNHLNREEIKEAFAGGTGESIRESETMNMNTHYYAVLLANGTVLRVGSDAHNMFSVMNSAAPAILAAVLLVVVICVLLGQYMTRQILRPVEEMVDNLDNTELEPAYGELKPFSEKIHRQYSEIVNAAKMREEFSANVSHELKTPLTAIRGYAELIETDEKATETHRHFASEIVKNSSRLQSLIDDTIMLSQLDRQEDKKMEPVRLDEAVSECLPALQINARMKDIALEYEDEPATVSGDGELLTQMAENLIQNAIIYNKENGWVKVRVHKENDRCLLSVSDNGIGIPEEDQSRSFERFYRVDKSRSRNSGGTGLGLAIVKHIAELHNAEIKLTSKVDEGTEITVTFKAL